MPYFREGTRTPLISSDALLGFRAAARELNLDPEFILREYGLDPGWLDKAEGYLEHGEFSRFLQTVSERYDCPHFGFVLGKHQPPMQLGIATRVMTAAPNLGSAIQNGLRYVHFFSEGTRLGLSIDRGLAQFRRWDAFPHDFSTTQIRMLGVVQMCNVVRALAGGDWQPSLISFSFRDPGHSEQMQRYFGCPILFDQAFDSLEFPERELSRPIASADPELLRMVTAQLDALFLDKDSIKDIRERAEHYIRQTIGSRRCSMESCARVLDLQPRTFQRKLTQLDVTFKQLLLQIRMQTARQYLADSGVDLLTLAGMLGYRNLSAFSRAFKQEHGVSPKEWKNIARCPQPGRQSPEP